MELIRTHLKEADRLKMSQIFSICFVTYFAFTTAFSNINYFEISERKLSSSEFSSNIKCILEIIDNDLKFRPTVVIVKDLKDQKDFFNIVIDKLIKNNIPQVIIEDINEINDTSVIHGDVLVIKVFENCEHLRNFSSNIIVDFVKYLIIINKNVTDNCSETFQEFGYKIRKYDVTFMIEDKIKIVAPFIDSNTCQEKVLSPTHINTCKNGLVKKSTVFPSKDPVNQNKCPFKVGIGPLYPYSMIKNRENLKNYDRLEHVEGLDLELIKIINKYFNGSLNLFYIFKKEESPFGNTEFLTFIMNGSLDACAGGLYRIYGEAVAYSGVYSKQTAIFMYYVERVNRSWQNIYGKVGGLYIFLIFYTCHFIIWYGITTFDKNFISLNDTLLYSWGALVGATSLQDARSLKQKIVNLMYLLMCIHFSAYVSIQLYSFLTISEPPATFKTNDDIMTSKRPLFLNASTKFFIQDDKYVKYASTSQNCMSFKDCSEKALENKGVTAVLDAHMIQFQASTAVKDEARMLKTFENLVFVYHEMIIRKDSPLTLRFRQVLDRLFESGIIEKLYAEAIGLSVVGKAMIANKNIINNSYYCQIGCEISLSELAGGFFVWVIGCFLSSCVFAIELVVHRKNNIVS